MERDTVIVKISTLKILQSKLSFVAENRKMKNRELKILQEEVQIVIGRIDDILNGTLDDEWDE